MINTGPFFVEQTGGGCTALVKIIADGTVLVLTDGNLGHKVNAEHAEPVAILLDSLEAWRNGNDGEIVADGHAEVTEFVDRLTAR